MTIIARVSLRIMMKSRIIWGVVKYLSGEWICLVTTVTLLYSPHQKSLQIGS